MYICCCLSYYMWFVWRSTAIFSQIQVNYEVLNPTVSFRKTMDRIFTPLVNEWPISNLWSYHFSIVNFRKRIIFENSMMILAKKLSKISRYVWSPVYTWVKFWVKIWVMDWYISLCPTKRRLYLWLIVIPALLYGTSHMVQWPSWDVAMSNLSS